MASADELPKQNQNHNDAEILAIKKKKEQAKKSELLREIHKLSVQIQTMEREKSTHIYSKRSEFYQEYQVVKEGEDKMTEERKTEKIRIQQQLDKMSHMIKRFQKELKDLKATPEFVERLKTIMDDIEGTITSFKEFQRKKYEDLMRSEQTLTLEIQQLEKKFESWNQIQTDSTPTTHLKTSNSSRDVTKDLPPEVAAFDKFVHQSGGHRGGWDEHDHQTFLRYRNMYKGRIVFLDHVKPLLPTRLESEIREHESWYQEYMFLNENKKHAIKKWREKKEDEKEDMVSKAKDDSDSDEEKKKHVHQIVAKERSDRFKQINAWKVQKELEKAMKEEKKMKEELEKIRKRDEDRKRQLESKKLVDEYRDQKKIEEEMLQLIQEEQKRNEEERKRITAAREITKFRSRDTQKLYEKLEQEKEKEEAKKEKEKRLAALKSQVHVEVARDPSRLLKPTSGWKERLKDQKPSGGGQVYVMPHRAVPSWRKS